MPKFNTVGTRAATGRGPLSTTPGVAPTINHQGGIGFTRDDKSDLFLLATTTVDLTADAFYEGGDARVLRFRDLVSRTAAADPDWTYRLLTWLRTKGNIRTAAVVGGIEAARALAASGIPGGRHMISTVLRRADEPGEAIAYHHAVHGRALSMAIKRGIGDAATRLYNEYAVLKYDTASHGVRFADVLALTHASPAADRPWQGHLFQHIIDRRYGRQAEIHDSLGMIRNNADLRALWAADGIIFPTSEGLRASGGTWEDVLSALGGKVDKAELWRALIPTMGFMALLRNLRNFDEAGLTDADVQPVIDTLSDPEQVRSSRQLPLRFLSAYRAAPSLRWAYPLERALDTSTENIPQLKGRTLILVDTSQSMNSRLSGRSDLMRWDAAVVFGLALARRCEHADVVSFSNNYYGTGVPWRAFPSVRGESLLRGIDRWKGGGFFLNAGTDTAGAVQANYAGHDRVVILTDEQVQRDGPEVSRMVPADRPLTTFNLAGYVSSHAATDRNRLLLGGLTDAMFPIIARVEQGYPGGWPWADDPDVPGLPPYGPQVAAQTRTGGVR